MRSSVVYVFVALLTAALCIRLYSRGGPFFERPISVFEHVGEGHKDLDDTIILCRRAAPLIPRGATVACFHPLNGVDQYDSASFLTAVGFLPKQQVLPPDTASNITPPEQSAQYVIAIGERFTNPHYEAIVEWPEGRLYKVR